VLNKLGGALTDGWGSVNTGAIEAVFRVHRIPQEDQPEIFDRLITYAAALRKKDG
jgi:hypothetical protein